MGLWFEEDASDLCTGPYEFASHDTRRITCKDDRFLNFALGYQSINARDTRPTKVNYAQKEQCGCRNMKVAWVKCKRTRTFSNNDVQ
jgi:hypothetical protein